MLDQLNRDIPIFVECAAELYKQFTTKIPMAKTLVLGTVVYSSGNLGLIVTDENKVIGKYSIYISSEGNIIKSNIQKDINVCYQVSKKLIYEIIEKKAEYLANPWKLLKYFFIVLRSVTIKDKSYTTLLKGKRTVLRIGNESDMAYLMQWYNDYELNKLAGWNNSKVTIERLRYNYSKSFGYDPMNLIIDNEYGKPIGTIQLYDFSDLDKSCKLGIRIGDRDYWGKGYGEDAVNTVLEYAFMKMDMNRVSLRVYEYNERAAKCYIKCGFEHEGRSRKSAYIDGAFYDEILMGILKSEFIRKRELKM